MNAEPTQEQVDTGAVGGENPFWKRVHLEFISSKPEYASVVFPEECFDGYDLSTPVQHSSKKLREMWEELCTAFTSVSARFSSSETPELGFLSFCLNRPVAPTKDGERAQLMQRIKEACETLVLVRSIELGPDLEGIVRFELDRYSKRLKSMQDEEKEDYESRSALDPEQASQSVQ
ncbi:hypothetical protein G195_007858 [Phytophthora kernoviae 00238/432]|uniref:Uncharacterized protein n=1 Tax=Phytophthora kernoviae 00238/432 TaxID=1284355 RepID=A0A8J4S428_9STRA|nr:hypothetical protein G195_007858 [Phytophthora kernoviae 00238/432]